MRKVAGVTDLQISACGAFCTMALSEARDVNQRLLAAYKTLASGVLVRHTHHFHGRYENVYIDLEHIPALIPVVSQLLAGACEILDTDTLRYGFWFNEMAPGHKTTRHNHDELDELLSCVYYIDAPDDSGDLQLYLSGETVQINPQAGKVIYFDPAIDHGVTVNKSEQVRLSVAFNFGLPI